MVESSYVTCFMMTSLIIFIQLVHYPSFKFIQDNEFIDFHRFHSRNISIIVTPLMLTELISTAYIFTKTQSTYWLIHLSLVLITWLSTFFLSVPAHNLLGRGKSTLQINRLVKTNWVRALAWILRSLLIINQGI